MRHEDPSGSGPNVDPRRSSQEASPARSGWRARLLVPSVLGLLGCGGEGTGAGETSLVHTVGRGSLAIAVRERAEVQAARDTRVSSQLEGRSTLIFLIPEGTVVKEGDKIAELDASAVKESRATQAILVAKAEAAMQQARKEFEIMEKELEAAEKTAQSRLTIARMRWEKFIGQSATRGAATGGGAGGTNEEMVRKLGELVDAEALRDPEAKGRHGTLVGKVLEQLGASENRTLAMGEMANQVLQLIDEISLARADLAIAEDTLDHSRQLADKGFIARNELERDLISHKRQLSRVTVAWNNLQLLIHYTLAEKRIELEQEIENAELGLESVRATNEARRVRQGADRTSSEAEFALAKERLDNWDRQIGNAVLRAPTAGLVVYGRYDWDEPVFEGMEVRERQEIILLPDVSKMVAELKVHEAQIDKVAAGQKASVNVDAFPDRSLTGRVERVSTLPEPGPRSQDLKQYRVRVLLDQDNRDGTLRPGMNATVEIDVGVLRDVLAVPVPAVKRHRDSHFVWRIAPRGPEAVPVKLGGNNTTHVEILEGLEEGDRIYLVPPEGTPAPALPGVPPPASEAGSEEARPATGGAADGSNGGGADLPPR